MDTSNIKIIIGFFTSWFASDADVKSLSFWGSGEGLGGPNNTEWRAIYTNKNSGKIQVIWFHIVVKRHCLRGSHWYH